LHDGLQHLRGHDASKGADHIGVGRAGMTGILAGRKRAQRNGVVEGMCQRGVCRQKT
jgi:hypothetical protein